jgi:hypothetical protein
MTRYTRTAATASTTRRRQAQDAAICMPGGTDPGPTRCGWTAGSTGPGAAGGSGLLLRLAKITGSV